MTIRSYRLPDGTVPILLSAPTPDLLRDEAAALLGYAAAHPETAPEAIADMLFRTRTARAHRALAMVTDRDELLDACRAIADGHGHGSVVCNDTPATARNLAFVFPGQGSQRPGMGRMFYESVPAYRAEVDRCVAAFQSISGESPLDYLLAEDFPAEDTARTVQPALFAQMAGLAATWRSFGVEPNITVGHSQGEIAAAYVSGAITLADAVHLVEIRSHAADEFITGDYAMAVLAADRDTCESELARSTGWAELSVVNSPGMTGISGERDAVQRIVETLTEGGIFARVIRVRYPAHTSMINALAEKVRAAAQRELQNPAFLDTETPCVGATLGTPITTDFPLDHYWFWNLRNTVRFDKAIAAALPLGADTFVELAEHPTLQLAIEENLAAAAGDRTTMVIGTSNRNAADLGGFTRNLALLAVHDLDYRWDSLCTESAGPTPLPLADFPNTRMNEVLLWLPYDGGSPERQPSVLATAEHPQPQLLAEHWVRLAQRSLIPPRTIGIVDHTGSCSELAAALCAAAGDLGATARVIDLQSSSETAELDTYVILVPQSPELDDYAAAAEVASFFGSRAWWPEIAGTITDCWLVTVGGEKVVANDPPPDLVHAAASAGFRSIGAEFPRVAFRHLDLPSGSTSATAILAALHTKEESELALRDGGLYAKRVTHGIAGDAPEPSPPEHVVITGGTGNLGLEFCEHFARRGARRITLVSRSGETAAVADRLRQIRSVTTTRIDTPRCDVGDQAAVSRLAENHGDVPADLIIHAALAYSDVDWADVTAETVENTLRAKVIGVWQLLRTFPRTDTCRVMLCSSAAATICGRGQIVYAAANRMLDAMAHRLRSEGLDCVSVQWGQWTVHSLDAAGMAKVTATGLLPMRPADALAVGMSPLRDNAIVAAFDLDRAQPVLAAYGYGPLISELVSPAAATPVTVGGGDLKQRLASLLAGAIGVDGVDAIDADVPMVAIGLDSLQALEFRRRVKSEFNYDLEVSDLLGGASIADVLVRIGG
ncbi:putative polyketide synthase MbtD [Mycobacterium sp. MFM001]|uniref:nocobactin polyketide synthase NbtC n=1 Tax=Mycobacterium sp. MFM001 TaxID=2049453 RepID=UPI000DA5D149|nr:nocobactin polyketide synthase NbtC [Mycobacterium sp. MFM001]GBE64984.1 putative polyketide synthase MbtD [Mycobacterium sp. MFM001]